MFTISVNWRWRYLLKKSVASSFYTVPQTWRPPYRQTVTDFRPELQVNAAKVFNRNKRNIQINVWIVNFIIINVKHLFSKEKSTPYFWRPWNAGHRSKILDWVWERINKIKQNKTEAIVKRTIVNNQLGINYILCNIVYDKLNFSECLWRNTYQC